MTKSNSALFEVRLEPFRVDWFTDCPWFFGHSKLCGLGKHMHGIVRTPTFEKLNEAMEPVNIKIETELEKAHILRRKKRTLKRRSERNKISFNTFL